MTTTIRGTDNSAAAPALTGNDSDTGIYFPAANKLGLVTGGTERVIVDDSGNVGIGTATTSGSILNIVNSGANDELTFRGTAYTSVISESTGGMDIKLTQSAPIIFYTSNTERIRVTDNGLTFNGDTAAANALDDYEEGTWTPSIEGASTAGTTTYGANRLGWYRKIGSQVTVYYYIQVSATTGTGSMRISNLPFTTASSGIQSVGSVMTYLLNWTGSTTSITTYADGNRNYLLLYISGDDVSWANQLMTNETFELLGTHTYFA